MANGKKLSAAEMAKNKKTLDYRKGKGRIKSGGGKKESVGRLKGSDKVAGSSGTRGVREGYTSSGRKTGMSDRVVKEKKASKIKSKGVVKQKLGGSMKIKVANRKNKGAYGGGTKA